MNVKKLLLSIALIAGACTTTYAQVTIGSGAKPVAGALLDLKDKTAETSPTGGPTLRWD